VRQCQEEDKDDGPSTDTKQGAKASRARNAIWGSLCKCRPVWVGALAMATTTTRGSRGLALAVAVVTSCSAFEAALLALPALPHRTIRT